MGYPRLRIRTAIVYLSILSFFLLQNCSAQTVNTHLIQDEIETVTVEKLAYYLYYPQAYEVNENESFPLLLFLHGGGEAGGTLSEVKSNGPPKLIAEGKQFPYLILAPQNPHKRKWWNTQAIMQLLDTVVKTNRVDPKRIYLTGLSRGGSAAWELAVQYPDKFAAMAVVCGMTPVPYASWLDKDMPIWVFHGEDDASIPVSESDEMVKKLKAMGRNVTYTRYKGVGHNAWEKAYANEELYEWFVQYERKQ
ncbi:carboxylesterase family protein [Spongiimicrobium salis]|uniref:carboxylesterase family protein n=1 Tax=Spongiimicrobium salis TaxID=1667022 RepID=UPI00374D3538